MVASNKYFEHNGNFSITPQYDTEDTLANLALETSYRGLVAHGMQGFDYQKARNDLEIIDDFDVMTTIVIGKNYIIIFIYRRLK